MSKQNDSIEQSTQFHYGLYLSLTDETIKELANAGVLTSEVLLEYNGQKRECSFAELVAFMKGEKGNE